MVNTRFQEFGIFNTLISLGPYISREICLTKVKHIRFSKIIQILILVFEHIYLRVLTQSFYLTPLSAARIIWRRIIQ